MQGDTCDSISSANGLSVAELNDLNPTLQCEALVPQHQVLCVAELAVGESQRSSHLEGSSSGYVTSFRSDSLHSQHCRMAVKQVLCAGALHTIAFTSMPLSW